MAVVQKDPSTPDSPAGGPTLPDLGGSNFNKAAFIFAVIVIVCAIIYHFR